MLARYIRFFLENKLVAYLLLILFVVGGLMTAPFDFSLEKLPRDPVAVDAIPDIGENQQIVFTQWEGRSPQDVEDQISYPLTTALLGIPGVKSVRSNSMFGFSSIYIIFKDEIEFYWSRSRILEKLNSLPSNTLPVGVQPTLGPDATALGQIFWYTLEGQDTEGNPTGAWDLHELRSIQDFYVRYGLSAAEGVAEVASIGGFVKEYQVDVDPEAMKAYGISLEQVMQAVQESNIDIGAQTMEINLAEYFVRGIGYVERIEDIEQSVIKTTNNVPVRITDVAKVSLGPASRRGVLDKSGAEAVGGVVVARYGSNPLEVIKNVKAKIKELEPGLPSKILADGTLSQVHIVPFYDRTQLINETIGTLQEALSLEVLITVIVVILLLLNLKSSLLVSTSLPVGVLMCFIAMRYFGVDANIVALSGIAIAIGTMVDMGIVMTESMVKRIREAGPEESLLTSIYEASTEVASAVVTAVATTIISFLPVFTMQAAEGKLFQPLAFTKTFALLASIIIAITIIPPLAHSIFSIKSRNKIVLLVANGAALIGGAVLAIGFQPIIGSIVGLVGFAGLLNLLLQHYSLEKGLNYLSWLMNIIYALIVTWLLASIWMPLGVTQSNFNNFLFVTLIAGGLISLFYLIIHFYENILRFLLRFKILFLLLVGVIVYQGFLVFQETGEEFMPALDEGSFLLMPTAMPHAGMQENIKNLRLLDMAVTAIPEVETVVGKAGRVNSPLDPAPMSMYENVILYKSEYKTNAQGHRIRYKINNGEYVKDSKGELIPDPKGQYYRQWRPEIKNTDDIWNEIVRVTQLPGVTSAPKLQPIETRLVMLQTGMRAPMGIKIQGANLEEIEAFGLELEQHLKEVEGVKAPAVFAERIVGKPYLLVDIKRDIISRYGLNIAKVQQYLQAAVGGMDMSTTVEGRERYNIRIRYPRALRSDPESIKQILVSTGTGQQIPLGELVEIRYEAGAQSIKSEDGFLVGYVLFDREADYAEVSVVNNAQKHLQSLIEDGLLNVPAGINYRFAGNYEQQVRANKRLMIVVPLALALIFLILYFQFKSVMISLMVFTGVFIAFAGGFIMIGWYNTPWFLDFDFFGVNMRDLFQIQSINLSVAVWVGFLALFGIATDDGVLVATFLKDSFKKKNPGSIHEIRDAVVDGGLRRVRPAMMTTATTILALLPILTSTGRGSDIMVPMAIPSFGGMLLQVITMFTVPVLYSLWQESKMHYQKKFPTNMQKSTLLMLVPILLIIGTPTAKAQSLESLHQKLISNNLDLQALGKDYEASLQKVPQTGQLEDPEIGLGFFPLPVQTRLGAQQWRVGLTQMFPWFGTLDQEQALASSEARSQLERIQIKYLEQRYQLELAYFELYQKRFSQNILQEHLDLLKILERLIISKVESGQASTAEVLKLRLETNKLAQEKRILQNEEANPLAKINRLLNQALDQSINFPDTLSLAVLPYRRDSLGSWIEQEHPAYQLFFLEQQVARERISLNDLSAKPSFGLGVDYINVGQRSDANPLNNGRDIVQFRASIKIPLSQRKYDAKAQEEQLKIQALDFRAQDLKNEFLFMIEQAFTQHESARLQYELWEDQQSITRAAIELLEAAYSAGKQDFSEILRLRQDLVQYDLNRLQAVVDSHLAKSGIERFINVKK